MPQSQSLTAKGGTIEFTLKPGESATYSASGTFTGFASLQRSRNGGASWETVTTGAADTAISGTVKNETPLPEAYRIYLADTDAETPVTGTLDVVLNEVLATVKRTFNAGVLAKAATSSGWATAAVDALSLATLAASLTSKKLVVPITGLKVGDTITGFHLVGQVESAGNNVVIDAELRKHTAAAADVADASVGSITQLTVAADTILSSANAGKTGLNEVVAADETFYILITGTTGSATDIALQGVALTIAEA